MEDVRDLIITAAVSFLVGVLIVFLLLASVSSIRRRSGERRSAGAATPRERRRVPLQKPKTSTVVLVFVAAFVLLFTNRMIELYEATGGIPDTLVVSVFGICGGFAPPKRSTGIGNGKLRTGSGWRRKRSARLRLMTWSRLSPQTEKRTGHKGVI